MGDGYAHSDPQASFESPSVFGGNGTLMPALRKVSFSAVNVNWVGYRSRFANRRQEASNTRLVRPTNSSPRSSPGFETLDALCVLPESAHPDRGGPARVSTGTKHLVFGRTSVRPAFIFHKIFQIPKSVETFSLVETESGLGAWPVGDPELFNHSADSSPIFNLLTYLGQEYPEREDHPRNKNRP